MKFFEPIPLVEVKQSDFTFYLFTISAKKLLSVSYTSERTRENRIGIQRGLKVERLKAIGKFYKGERETPILPNSIIISLSKDSKVENDKIIIADKPKGEAFVIDGQHRLWAFDPEYSGDIDFNIVVSAFIDLPDDKKALIFKTINGEQRKINPSLVYDLIPMLREKNFVKFEDSRTQELVEALNYDNNPDSAWGKRIGMVGEGDKIISQSSFITGIKKLFKKGHLFHQDDPDFFEQNMQETLLKLYFNAVAKYYSQEWDNKAFLICKYVGVSSLLNLLEKIILDLRSKRKVISDQKGLIITSEAFDPYLTKLRQFNFSAKEEKEKGRSYVGEGGINELTKKITSLVFET